MKFEVIQNYDDAPDNPIAVRYGESLLFIEESDPDGDWAGWINCKGEGKQGWVPKQILKLTGKSVLVLEDYCAVEHNLKAGDTLISRKELNGWIWCSKESVPDAYAWAPLNHLRLLD